MVFLAEGGWGLNFMTETDAMKFLEGCSVRNTHPLLPLLIPTPTQPPTLTPTSERLRHALSTLSLSLPIPEPHTSSETQLDEVILQSRLRNFSQSIHKV